MHPADSVSEILARVQPGDERTVNALLPLVYKELRSLAAHCLDRSGGRADKATLQPTALVHEAYLKMVGGDRTWAGRDHFMSVAAIAMRQVLVDHSRRRKALKRGSGGARAQVSIDSLPDESGPSREMRVLELDELLTQLSAADERAARVTEMRLFGGMECEQIARVLGVSRTTIDKDWKFARAWLVRKVGGGRVERSAGRE